MVVNLMCGDDDAPGREGPAGGVPVGGGLLWDEWVRDVLSIVTSFSGRLCGRWSALVTGVRAAVVQEQRGGGHIG